MTTSNRIDGSMEAKIRDPTGRVIFAFKPNSGRHGNIEQGVIQMLDTLEEKYQIDWDAVLQARREARGGA